MILALAFVVGCGGEKPAAWALQHAEVDTLDGGLSGYHTWEFYSKGWRKKHDEKHHLCARVQEIFGESTSALEGCTDCSATYTVRTEELEHDCSGAEGSQAGFRAMTHFAFGPLPEDLAGDAPHPDETLGWYISWDAAKVEVIGYAWNAALDEGDALVARGWADGERYVLYPALAWEL